MYKVKKHIGIRIFFLALFLSYFADITFFTHSHIVNGVTIVHSHYSCGKQSSQNDAPEKHTHSGNALTLISQAAAWIAIILSMPELVATFPTEIITYSAEIPLKAEQTSPPQFHLRGPPVKFS